MPTFFIHIHNGTGTQIDEAGSIYVSAGVAVAEAAKMAGELMHDEVQAAPVNVRSRVVIEDERHAQVAEISMEISLPAAANAGNPNLV